MKNHSISILLSFSFFMNFPELFSAYEYRDESHEKIAKVSPIVEMALSLSHHYFVPCAVLMHPYHRKQLPLRIFKFMKFLTFPNDGISSVAQNFVEYSYYISEQEREKCSKTINIIYGEDSLIQEPFIKLTHQVSMAGSLWLVILNKKTVIAEFLKGAVLPLNVNLVLAQPQNEELISLHEAYRITENHPIRVENYGQWSKTSGLKAPDHISLYYRRSDLEGLIFRVACSDSFPVVRVVNKNGEVSISGYFANVWEELSLRLNFSSKYIMMADGSGMMVKDDWTGVTGAVKRGEADIGIAAFTITPERYSSVDFLRPLISTRNNLILKNPGIEILWNAIFRPFGSGVWIALLTYIVCASIFLKCFIYVGSMNHFEPAIVSSDFTLLNSFFYLLRAFSQQATPSLPASYPSRIVLITSYFASVIILTAYSGALISFIAVQIPRLPFTDLVELVDQGSYALQVVHNTAAYMLFANSSHPVLHNAFKLMTNKLPKTMEEGLERLCYQHKLVHFGPQAVMDLIVQRLNLKGCNIISLPHPLNSVYLSIIIQKSSPYTEAFNHHLDMMIYQGLLGRLRKQLWPTLGAFSPQINIEVQTEQVVPIYMILAFGVTVSAIILGIEICKHQKHHNNQDRMFNKLDIIV